MSSLESETDRLRIRNLFNSDLPAFHLYRSNPEVTKYQGFNVFTLEEARAFIEEHAHKALGLPGQWVQYGIENQTTAKLIGDCLIRLDGCDKRLVEIGITISSQEQRKEYAKEALIS